MRQNNMLFSNSVNTSLRALHIHCAGLRLHCFELRLSLSLGALAYDTAY